MKYWKILVVLVYSAVLLALLMAELGLPGFDTLRATNQVLLLVALFFLPFAMLASASVIKSVTVKVSGQELHLELGELREHVDSQMQRAHRELVGRITTAEQILLPILAGEDVNHRRRVRTRRFIVGSKEFRSQRLLAHIVAFQLERQVAGVSCARHTANGGTLKNFADLTRGWIDAYIEYTGTGCLLLGIDHRGKSLDETLQELNERSVTQHGIKWLTPLGITTDYRVVMRDEHAKRLNLKTLDQLRSFARDLVFCADVEFLNRPDGFIGLRRSYQLQFCRTELASFTDRYEMLQDGRADVGIGYETDPELQTTEFTSLEDTASHFPSYHAVPVVRVALLEEVAEVENAMRALGNRITNERIMLMESEMESRGDDEAIAEDIARRFVDQLR